jgi:hypothetical protein
MVLTACGQMMGELFFPLLKAQYDFSSMSQQNGNFFHSSSYST